MIKRLLVVLGLSPPKCSYCEQTDDGDGYYYFCSLSCLQNYCAPGSCLDRDLLSKKHVRRFIGESKKVIEMARYNDYVRSIEVNLSSNLITFRLDSGKEILCDSGELAEILIAAGLDR